MNSSFSFSKASSLSVAILMAGLALLLVLFTVATAGPASANNQATLSFVAPQGTIPVETEISVTVRISDVIGLWAAGITIDFPPDMLQVIDADPLKTGVQISTGDCPDPDMHQGFIVENKADNTLGTIRYALTQLAPTPPVDGDCNVFHIHFLTIDGPIADLHFNSVTLSDIDGIDIPVTTIDRQLSLEEAEQELFLPLILKK